MNNDADLSERLFLLRRRLSDFTGTGIVLSGDDVTAMVSELKELGLAANAIEHRAQFDAFNRNTRGGMPALAAIRDAVINGDPKITVLDPFKRRPNGSPKGAA